jgi:hypothetical protein
MPSYSQTLRVLVVAAMMLLFVLSAGAQSGRKVRKSTPPPVPTPTPNTALAKPKEDPKPALTLIVGMQQANVFDTARIGNAGALQSLEDRLDDHPGVKVARLWGDITRGDAIRRAKSEKEAYVVLLELSLETGAGSRDEELLLYYWVFSPVTAKIKTSGQTYVRMYRNRGVIRNPRTANIYGDYEVQEASRQAAERILKAFQLHLTNNRTVL